MCIRDSYKAVNGNSGYCDACFTKNYPVPLVDQTLKKQQKEQIKLVWRIV